jgi:hypothetical protein
MKSISLVRIGFWILLLAFFSSAVPAGAVVQSEDTPELLLLSFRPQLPNGLWSANHETAFVQSEMAILLLTLLAIGVLAVGVEAIDRARSRRREEAALLQARIVDGLLRDPRLTVLAVTATVQLPLWRRSPARIEIWGQVPTVELCQAVLQLAGEVTSRLWAAYRLHDRIAIVPSIAACAT